MEGDQAERRFGEAGSSQAGTLAGPAEGCPTAERHGRALGAAESISTARVVDSGTCNLLLAPLSPLAGEAICFGDLPAAHLLRLIFSAIFATSSSTFMLFTSFGIVDAAPRSFLNFVASSGWFHGLSSGASSPNPR